MEVNGQSQAGAKRRQRLFEHFRADQQQHCSFAPSDGHVLCPLCWNEVPFADLTLEHIVPRSVGGTTKTISCSRCNPRHGSSIDSHVATYLKCLDALRGNGTLRGTLHINGHRAAVNIAPTGDPRRLEIVGAASNPRAVDGIRADMDANLVDELALNFQFGYAPGSVNRSLIRTAYLAMFHEWGYSYAKLPVVQAVRRWIVEENDSKALLPIGLISFNNRSTDGPFLIVQLTVKDLPVFVVIIRLRRKATGTTEYRGVWMPDFESPPDTYFDDVARVGKGFKSMTVGVTLVDAAK